MIKLLFQLLLLFFWLLVDSLLNLFKEFFHHASFIEENFFELLICVVLETVFIKSWAWSLLFGLNNIFCLINNSFFTSKISPSRRQLLLFTLRLDNTFSNRFMHWLAFTNCITNFILNNFTVLWFTLCMSTTFLQAFVQVWWKLVTNTCYDLFGCRLVKALLD